MSIYIILVSNGIFVICRTALNEIDLFLINPPELALIQKMRFASQACIHSLKCQIWGGGRVCVFEGWIYSWPTLKRSFSKISCNLSLKLARKIYKSKPMKILGKYFELPQVILIWSNMLHLHIREGMELSHVF